MSRIEEMCLDLAKEMAMQQKKIESYDENDIGALRQEILDLQNMVWDLNKIIKAYSIIVDRDLRDLRHGLYEEAKLIKPV